MTGSDEDRCRKAARSGRSSPRTRRHSGRRAVLVGGTAWVFSREELGAGSTTSFIDEAGQFSLANAVAVGLSTRNLILVGDQMQLAQVTQGRHPGDTGRSCLEYLLDGQRHRPRRPRHVPRREPADAPRPLPLRLRRRLRRPARQHPGDHPAPGASARPDTVAGAEGDRHRVGAGGARRLHPVERRGVRRDRRPSSTSCSGVGWWTTTASSATMTRNDILIVAPFNLQVRCLRERLQPGSGSARWTSSRARRRRSSLSPSAPRRWTKHRGAPRSFSAPTASTSRSRGRRRWRSW